MKKLLLLLPLILACQAGKARSLLVLDVTKASGVPVLNRLSIEAGSTVASKDTDAPAKLGVYLPSSVSGKIHVVVWGERDGTRVGRGEADADVVPGEITNVSVSLQLYADLDGGTDVVTDGAADAGSGGSIDASDDSAPGSGGAGGGLVAGSGGNGSGGASGSGGSGAGGGGSGGSGAGGSGSGGATGSGGVLTPASLSVSPTSLDFGRVWVGLTSDEKSFTITNSGGQASGAVSFSSNLPTTFVIQSPAAGDCVSGTALAGNSSCTVRVKFVSSGTGSASGSIAVTATGFSKPVTVAGAGNGIRGLAAGQGHSCAVLADGTVKCWGDNSYGQLGINSSATSKQTPTTVNLTGVTQVVAGMYHTCALLTAGTVRCWGRNDRYQLGSVVSSASSPAPAISGLNGVSSITAGSSHTCALLSTGAVSCWGDNSFGQLGDGSAIQSTPTPVAVSGGRTDIRAIAAGGDHTCRSMLGNTVQCWGDNYYGQLGDGTTMKRSVPTDVPSLTGVTQVRTGSSHSCALLAAGGVLCWGAAGPWSNLGATAILEAGGAITRARWIGSGYFCSCAVFDGGAAKCWGRNTSGELGTGDLTSSSVALTVSGLTGVVEAADNFVGGYAHTCAVVDGGAAAKCWGDNSSGQLGDGTTERKLTPVQVALP